MNILIQYNVVLSLFKESVSNPDRYSLSKKTTLLHNAFFTLSPII